jgi:chorismate dehydratase
VAKVRIGTLPYLNARPLIYGLEDEVVRVPPVTLAKLLRTRAIDVALAPSVMLFDSDEYRVLPGISISSRGPVRSVVLFHLRRLERLRTVVVDYESRTAVMLLKVLLAKKYNAAPQFIPAWPLSLRRSTYDAQLLIGDTALLHRDAGSKLDLGADWDRFVQVPFTYAMWIARRDVELGDTVERLQAAKAAIIGGQRLLSKRVLRRYYEENIRYDLGDEELFGFQLFNRLCVELGLAEKEISIDFCR